MSTSRDLIWFRSRSTAHWSDTIGADTIIQESITANVTNTKATFPTLVDIHNRLNGQIESIAVVLAQTPVAMDVIFYSGPYVTTATIDTDRYIAHESFLASDFILFGNDGSTLARASLTGLQIPYVDITGQKEFHIGVVGAATAIPGGGVVVEWTWRADRGEH